MVDMMSSGQASSPVLGCIVDDEREFGLGDYEGARARWCPGCGDHSILTAVEKLLVAEQLRPEQTVFVSGIGCSSRFPHYLKTYGFHGIHGRALPVATGIKLHRPDLTVFVVMGDGDCCSIGAAHWIHAIRYNMPMVVLLLDNGIYGLTKKQTSPTTRLGIQTNTHPAGSILPPLNPLTTTLGTTNVSFVAQTAEWIPAHLYATLRTARQHNGFAFVRILQRCPIYLPGLYDDVVRDPRLVEMLVHDDGVLVPELEKIYTRRVAHDPRDLAEAQRLAAATDVLRLGVFFRDGTRPTYDALRRPTPRSITERMALLNAELDKYAV
jgi:2-oxoglutarate/2-oxoacid ferredoxin oxidoreductase subunit beta